MKTCKDCENFLIFKDYEEGIVYQTCKAEKETPQVDCAFHKSAQQNMHWTAGIVRRFNQFPVVKFILSLWHSLASRQ